MTDLWGEGGRADEVAATAATLGGEARQLQPAFPWVIAGTVDGRAWALRERTGQYEVSIAPDDDPLGDPQGRRAVTIRTGSAIDLLDGTGLESSPAVAVRLVVRTVRTYQRQATCTHETAPTSARWCPACGTPLVDPALP